MSDLGTWTFCLMLLPVVALLMFRVVVFIVEHAIEKEKKMTKIEILEERPVYDYHVGDFVILYGRFYIITQMASSGYNLVNLKFGGVYSAGNYTWDDLLKLIKNGIKVTAPFTIHPMEQDN